MKYCPNCNNAIDDNLTFCNVCNAPQYVAQPQRPYQQLPPQQYQQPPPQQYQANQQLPQQYPPQQHSAQPGVTPLPPPPAQSYQQVPAPQQPYVPPVKPKKNKTVIAAIISVVVVVILVIASLSYLMYDPDSDGDGISDDYDAFPYDPTESRDTDGDYVGDNSDVFPTDPTEWADYDQDGLGDNSDYNTRHFEWEYKPSTNLFFSDSFTWDVCIYHSYYTAYKGYNVEERNEYGLMITTNDPAIKDIAEGLRSASQDKGYGSYDEASFVLAFVQTLPYITDIEGTGYDHYSKFPIETLFEQEGDCEDSSILYATLMESLGYEVCLLKLPSHMAVGVCGEDGLGDWYVLHNGKKYYYCETIATGNRIGDMPSEYANVDVEVIEITGEQWVPDYEVYE